MMKKSLLLFCALTVLGCSYGGNYLENPEMFIKDPHFAAYKNNRDDLELRYVHKEITYAEYVKQKDQIDEKYNKEIQERNEKIMSPE